ncbi:hypothetical protein CTI14_54175, partial [Methylobacterium radiotolerans]
AKPVIEEKRKELVQRLGEEKGMRIAETNRNLVIFPNLVINDGSSITVRTFFPVSHNHMKVTAWALGPKEESEVARRIRLDSYAKPVIEEKRKELVQRLGEEKGMRIAETNRNLV